MPSDPKHSDQFEKDADAIRGGGATTDRGHRDAGMPGPDRKAVEKETERDPSEDSGRPKSE